MSDDKKRLTIEPVNDAVFNAVNWDRTEVYGTRFDGCIHISNYSNGYTCDNPETPPGEIDYLHVCDADEHILNVFAVIQEARSRPNFEQYWVKPAEVVQRLINMLPPEERATLKL